MYCNSAPGHHRAAARRVVTRTVPRGLVRSQLPLKVGDPIQADRIQGAEANVSLMLPQMGYPFVKVGERDILLDDEAQVPTGAYTLPVDTGPRASFGQLRTEGDAVFDIEHLNVFPRFEAGQLYDNRMTDDLRDALVKTAAMRVVALNLAPQPGETDGYSPETHLEVLCAHAPELTVDVVVADESRVLDRHGLMSAVESAGGRLVLAPVSLADGTPRHDPRLLAAVYQDVMRGDR